MGNCLRHESETHWGGEEWGSPVPEKCFASDTGHGLKYKGMNMDKEKLHGLSKGGLSLETSTTKPSTEVKIKITKKQLEALLGRTDLKGLSVQQVLSQLMNVSDQFEEHRRSWRPNLQSIPE